ncbi:MAG TPA: hypothetical protein VGX25_11750 [Actinophytocola sp.]|uniref:hypothetical protein n=1 Tax=Actinophytocola sp. TaxID=1872138 RepID=UPI002DDC9009|nr:hypothetical protein [Actinophytocola sp.]HEV2780057.1 hypothetical protein [Actinophytocola sp.]
MALPGLALAGFGVAHPSGLDAATAQWWATLHVLLLPVFPLLAAALWILLAPAPPVLRRPGRLAAFGFATFYTGLDAVAGIAAGTVVRAERGPTPALGEVFAIGDTLGTIGAWSFLAAGLILVAATARHAGWRALPGALLLLPAAVSFLDSHIFWPRGVLTMIAIAAGLVLLSLAGSRRPSRSGSQGA